MDQGEFHDSRRSIFAGSFVPSPSSALPSRQGVATLTGGAGLPASSANAWVHTPKPTVSCATGSKLIKIESPAQSGFQEGHAPL